MAEAGALRILRKTGWLKVYRSDAAFTALDRELALASEFGIPFVRLDADGARALEPNLSCTSALLSPVTGVIDSHAFMLSLQGDAENAGAVPVFHSPVSGGRAVPGGIEIDVGGADPMTLRCRLLVDGLEIGQRTVLLGPPTIDAQGRLAETPVAVPSEATRQVYVQLLEDAWRPHEEDGCTQYP